MGPVAFLGTSLFLAVDRNVWLVINSVDCQAHLTSTTCDL